MPRDHDGLHSPKRRIVPFFVVSIPFTEASCRAP
ncbi:hypothetical protein RLEG3_27190 [Rhizobium leguminosarum bv. trifolii WSM1689]|nr:hypothetical protein RLEG3_27190 [Rhizobium leguminosarum bv. trifolii WSM1689]